MYRFDPNTCYTMPTCTKFRDPRPWEAGGMRYGSVTSLSVRFLTDRKAVEACLPEPFEVDAEPAVSVTFQECRDVDWLAGRGYNLVGVDVAAVFNGQQDRGVRGGYCVVMWEDMCEPIIGGREHSGVPKVFADIDFHRSDDDGRRCQVSRFSHEFLCLSINGLQALTDEECRQMEQTRLDSTWMNYKYIPRLENDGADVAYATVYPSSGQCASAWRGTGEIEFRGATFRQAPTQHEVISFLASLPVHEVQSAVLANWKEVMALDRLPRRLS